MAWFPVLLVCLALTLLPEAGAWKRRYHASNTLATHHYSGHQSYWRGHHGHLPALLPYHANNLRAHHYSGHHSYLRGHHSHLPALGSNHAITWRAHHYSGHGRLPAHLHAKKSVPVMPWDDHTVYYPDDKFGPLLDSGFHLRGRRAAASKDKEAATAKKSIHNPLWEDHTVSMMPWDDHTVYYPDDHFGRPMGRKAHRWGRRAAASKDKEAAMAKKSINNPLWEAHFPRPDPDDDSWNPFEIGRRNNRWGRRAAAARDGEADTAKKSIGNPLWEDHTVNYPYDNFGFPFDNGRTPMGRKAHRSRGRRAAAAGGGEADTVQKRGSDLDWWIGTRCLENFPSPCNF